MKLDVPATRMELLRLKKRLPIAHRGHKLLKDKLDELIHNMMELSQKIRNLRKEVDQEIATAFGSFYFAQSRFHGKELGCALLMPMKKIEIKTEFHRHLLGGDRPGLRTAPGAGRAGKKIGTDCD